MNYRIAQLILFMALFLISHILAQWAQVGPSAGTVRSLHLHGSSLLASTHYGGTFQSSDYGHTWNFLHPGLLIKDFFSNGSEIYAVGNGLYHSNDSGKNFINLVADQPDSVHLRNVVDDVLAYGPYLIAAGGIGLYRSEDGGATWSDPYTGEYSQLQVHCLTAGESFVYAGTHNGIYRSADSGATWQYAGRPDQTATMYYILALGDSLLFAGNPNYRGFNRSIDGGENWESFGGFQSGVNHLFFEEGNLYAVSGGWGYRSSDTGITWTAFPDSGFHPLTVRNDTIFAIKGTAGIFRSVDGGENWGNISVNGVSIYTNPKSIEGVLYTGIAASQVLFRSENNGESWTQHETGTTNVGIVGIGEYLLVGGGGIKRSSNRGNTWNETDGPIGSSYLEVKGPDLFVMARSGVYRSIDSGLTWNITTPDSFPEMRFLFLHEETLFATGYWSGIYRTQDNGENWERVGNGVKSIPRAMAANNFGIFCSSDSGLYHSTDNGENWARISQENTIRSLATVGSALFAVKNFGDGSVIVSSDGGVSWQTVSDNLPVPATYMSINNEFLFVGSTGAGLWRRPISEMVTLVDPFRREHDGVILKQNFSNIDFYLPQKEYASLMVYDLSGKFVSTLAQGIFKAGYHRVSLYGHNVKKRVFFVRLVTQRKSQAVKVLLKSYDDP